MAVVATMLLSLMAGLLAWGAVPVRAAAGASTDWPTHIDLAPRVLATGFGDPVEIAAVAEGDSWRQLATWEENVEIEVYDDVEQPQPDAIDESSVVSDGNVLRFSVEPGLSDGDYSADFYADGTYLGSATFYVGDDYANLQTSLVLIQGHVLGTDDQGIAGICVSGDAELDDSYGWASDVTGDDGAYQLPMIIAGEGDAAKGTVSLYDCDSTRQAADEIYVSQGDSWVDFGDLEVWEPNVYDHAMVQAAYVDVTVEDPNGVELEDCNRLAGPFPPGDQTVHVRGCESDGVEYADVFVGNTRNPEAAEVLTLDEGDRLSRTVTVQPRGYIAGEITDLGTGQAPTSCVQVYERVDGVRGFASQRVHPTGDDAMFELPVAAGEAVVEFDACTWFGDAEPFPYIPEFYNDKPSLDQADPVTVTAGSVVSGIDAALTPDDAAFSDVLADHQFYEEIKWLVDRGITSGFADGTFQPTRSVSRQAAVVFLYRLAGEPEGEYSNEFSDVSPDHPFHDEISWAVQEGITSGYADDTFRPNNDVTRQAMAAFLYRVEH